VLFEFDVGCIQSLLEQFGKEVIMGWEIEFLLGVIDGK
jgi:hypothetical protein